MRENRTSGSVEGVVGNHDSYSDPIELGPSSTLGGDTCVRSDPSHVHENRMHRTMDMPCHWVSTDELGPLHNGVGPSFEISGSCPQLPLEVSM